jgi:hypothetical protein
MTTPSWWEAHGPVETHIECSGTEHRLRWGKGVFEALDHADPQGERTLAALGGEPCPCVELLQAWEHHSADLRVLTLASRGPGDVASPQDKAVGIKPALVGRRAPYPSAQRRPPLGWSSIASGSTAPAVTTFRGGRRPPTEVAPESEDDLLALFRLGTALVDRLAATVIATWSERLTAGDERCTEAHAVLAAALFGRATIAARTWSGDPGLDVVVEMASPGSEAALTHGPNGLQISLPFQWLSDIWATGLAVVLGRFGLWLIESVDERKRVMTIDRNLDDVRPITISIEEKP